MPHLVLVLTLALVAGLAGGVLVDVPVDLASAVVLSAAWATALLSFRRGWPRVQLAAVSLLVGGSGWVLGAHAVDRALHPPLRTLLEQRLGGFAIGLPEMGIGNPIVVEGRLREDASLTATGAVLRIDVVRVWMGAAPQRADGGISVSVGGVMQPQHLSEWTAGRVVRAPALLRRPARYLNAGVPDQERALARRGVALVGSIKSAALVDVVSPGRWWEERAAAIRARTRHALTRHVQPRSEQSAAIATAILIGDRAGLDAEVERRLQEAGTYHVIAISGGNIAILAGLAIGLFWVIGVRGRWAAA
ncbi:MAG: ComEC/Rec2 family competence protein, partial [Acidobacteria bacterium]|nr:ComEC/Rec2 family competence protein [Acidobacteriota bacterium]